MRRIVWVVAVLALVGYVFYSRMENKARLEAEHAEKEKIEQATKAAVYQMASRTNAVTYWEDKLRKAKKGGAETILTVELERLWLQQKPILFIGEIRDIATYDSANRAYPVKTDTHYI